VKKLLDMENNELFPYKIDHLQSKDGIEYIACKNAAVAHITNLKRFVDREMKYPAKLNGFIVLLCTKGDVTISVQMKEYKLIVNSLLIAPASVVVFRECHDCELYIMAFNAEFAADMNVDMKMIMPIMSSLHADCIVHQIKAEHSDKMSESFHNLYEEYKLPNKADVDVSIYREMALRHMYTVMIYRLCEFIATVNRVDAVVQPKDRSGDYFKQLVGLMHEYYKTERSVEFYADKMNLTSKHLSRVVRNYSGKSVHQWIDEFVVLEIKNLLKYSDMSIQQISYELNFPNPSFMGQYFKRITGKTPGEYRREI